MKREINEAKRNEAAKIFSELKFKLGSAQAVAEKLGIPAARVNVLARGASMGTNSLRAKAKKLLASLP